MNMTNLEKIRRLSPIEFANFMWEIHGFQGMCKYCSYDSKSCFEVIREDGRTCVDGIIEWLESDDKE
jgi:hypothetical protein